MNKKLAILLSAVLMLVSLFPMGIAETAYQGTGPGYGGELKVEVVMEGETIKDILLLENRESSPVVKRAFPAIRDRILEAQTPVVDSVSAATFTSYGVKSAVANALREAGKEVEKITFDTKGPEKEPVTLEPVKTDIVIIGGGPAGLTAAIAAKEAGVENVIVIEKLGIISGNGKFDMNCFDVINSKAQKDAGMDYTKEMFIESKQNAGETPERLQAWAEGANEQDAWLRSFGVELNHCMGGTVHMAEVDAYAGEEIQDGMEARVRELNVDIRTDTKGYDFVFDGDKVVGVKVQHLNESYDILADAVILATGGFSANKELLAKYAPGAEIVATSNQMGATGDFVPLFEKYDYQIKNMDVLIVFKQIIKHRRDLTGAGDGFIFVNENGERFADESSSGLGLAHKILEQKKVFYIYDQALYDSSYRLVKHNKLGYHTKADTLEELAAALKIDAENLKASVDGYNKGVAGEAPDPFREKSFTRPFAAEGPYYGVQIESAIHMTKGGVVTDAKARVLNKDNQVVEGLYAAGEVTWISGAYSAAMVFGRIAGQEAAAVVLQK
ncbi:MAG: FAD-binding protein [Eubacteriales bacterium]|nr:FAD-binding protein [Eubacteriales bacterium]